MFAPQVLVAGFLAVFVIAFAKGAFGGGMAVAGIPILALVMDPVDAAVVLAPLLPLMDLATLRVFPPSTWSMRDFVFIVAGVFLGMLAGAALLGGLPRWASTALVGAAILAFALRHFLLRPKLRPPIGPSAPQAIGWGLVGGLTTFLANAGQPPVAVYLVRRGLSKTVYAGTMSGIFTIANLTRLPLMAAIGLDRLHLLAYSAALAPVIPLGAYLGKRLHDRLDRDRMFLCVYALIALAGVKLLADAAALAPSSLMPSGPAS